jgi:mono/diheme cytochrome c family protein
MAKAAQRRRFPIAALLVACALAAGAAACSPTDDDETTGNSADEARTSPEPAEGEQPLGTEEERGKELFTSNCGSCHTLDAAGTQGQIGPNLDEAQVDEAEVLKVIDQGGRGSGNMPPDLVTGEDAKAVAAFVAGSGPGS